MSVNMSEPTKEKTERIIVIMRFLRIYTIGSTACGKNKQHVPHCKWVAKERIVVRFVGLVARS